MEETRRKRPIKTLGVVKKDMVLCKATESMALIGLSGREDFTKVIANRLFHNILDASNGSLTSQMGA